MKYESERIVIWRDWILLLPAALIVVMILVPWLDPPNLAAMGPTGKTLLLCFLSLWTGGLLYLLWYSLNHGCQTVTIDLRGVRRRRMFSTLELSWTEIGDWGLISGQRRSRGTLRQEYTLYFSRESVGQTRRGRRRYRNDTVRVMLFSLDEKHIWEDIIPLCQKRSMVKPTFE